MTDLNIRITTAPCCWGVDDIKNPYLPSWQTVLGEASLSGYDGLELGPYGYLPIDKEIVRKALKENHLFIVAGTIFDDLVTPSNRNKLLKQTDDICNLISQLPNPHPFSHQHFNTPYLTIMDWGHDERDFNAGHSDRAPRLNPSEWQNMMETIKIISHHARDYYDIRAVIHPHAGGYIEFEDEIEKLINDIDLKTAGLCLDTGHAYYSGMDPVQLLHTYKDRIDYIHFKDIDLNIYQQVMKEKIRFFEACAKGVMCPIGRGIIDYRSIRQALVDINYEGYITIEQERDPRNVQGSLQDVKSSRDFLLTQGFQ